MVEQADHMAVNTAMLQWMRRQFPPPPGNIFGPRPDFDGLPVVTDESLPVGVVEFRRRDGEAISRFILEEADDA